ncbi:hypothetical protein B0H14DRAFT_3534564 [Mycena olivaceomarginata]|nr:hypothetical protein B0H14DRAFT_3534564 [Mycena olivaceomarginata]
MAPRSWADPQQITWLQSWMPEFITRQAESKLHMFWPTMQEAWFQKHPKERILGLPLPTDPKARDLTPDKLTRLGTAITARKGQLENWFRNHRKKLGNANGPAAGTTMALRAHKHVEVFQIRNAGLITDKLAEEGYNTIADGCDDNDDWTDESQETPEAIKKRKKSHRMRMRTRVVQALWAEASKEERQAVEEEVEKEKKELREEEMRREASVKEAKANTPGELQEGIDALETTLAEIHKAIFLASGWTGITLVGGPNPRMGGDLTLKVLCFGQTPGGNDFEECCTDFDANVLKPFQDFLRLCYSLADRQACALPHRAPVVSDEPPAQRILPPEPSASEPVKTKKTKSKKKTQLKAPGGKTSAKPKNKTLPSMSIVTPSLMNGPDAVVASADESGVPRNDNGSESTATPPLTTGPDATTIVAGTGECGFLEVDNNPGFSFSNLVASGWSPAASSFASPHSSVANSVARNLGSLHDLDLNNRSSATSSFTSQLLTDTDRLRDSTSFLDGLGANVFDGDFADDSIGFDNAGFHDDEDLFPKIFTTPPRGVDDPPPQLYLPDAIQQGEVLNASQVPPRKTMAASVPSPASASASVSSPHPYPLPRPTYKTATPDAFRPSSVFPASAGRTLAAVSLESIISAPAMPTAPVGAAPVHVSPQPPPIHVAPVTVAVVPGSCPLAKAPATPDVPGSRPLAKPPTKPSTKPVVASKVGKKEAAAAAAAKKSGLVEEVEKRKRGRPHKQLLTDVTNEEVATTDGTFPTPALEPATPTNAAGGTGWSEKTVNGALVVTLTNPTDPQTRTRKPTRLADGSLPQREVKGTRIKKPAPLDTVEEALLARAKTGSKRKSAKAAGEPAKKKRKA